MSTTVHFISSYIPDLSLLIIYNSTMNLISSGLLLALLSTLPGAYLQCPSDSLVLYHVTLKTHWNPRQFPRHFPGFGYRPSAQWSRLVGRTHNSSYSLFRIGEMASSGLKKFAETSSSDTLDEMNGTGVFDAFNGPPITSGEGQTQAQFFLDGNHSQVSMVIRIVPSPDWFTGVDSVDLCVHGQWIDALTIDLDPIDSGTDNGYTFSAPNWNTVPPEAIYQIYSVRLHPAHSFYREDRTEKPQPFSTLSILKLKEYSLSALRVSGSEASLGSSHHHLLDDIESNFMANELRDEKIVSSSRSQKRKRSRRMRAGGRSFRDCVVSEWSDWSECSVLCGIGEQQRSRYISNHPRGTGSTCPPLLEKRLCNSARECRDNYFDW